MYARCEQNPLNIMTFAKCRGVFLPEATDTVFSIYRNFSFTFLNVRLPDFQIKGDVCKLEKSYMWLLCVVSQFGVWKLFKALFHKFLVYDSLGKISSTLFIYKKKKKMIKHVLIAVLRNDQT